MVIITNQTAWALQNNTALFSSDSEQIWERIALKEIFFFATGNKIAKEMLGWQVDSVWIPGALQSFFIPPLLIWAGERK